MLVIVLKALTPALVYVPVNFMTYFSWLIFPINHYIYETFGFPMGSICTSW